jgi:hypothetical protein
VVMVAISVVLWMTAPLMPWFCSGGVESFIGGSALVFACSWCSGVAFLGLGSASALSP